MKLLFARVACCMPPRACNYIQRC